MTKTLKTERQVMMLAMAATLIAMTRLEYNQFRGWTLPADEDGEDEGFLVNFGFHTAWWPKDVVDKHSVAQPHPINSVCTLKHWSCVNECRS